MTTSAPTGPNVLGNDYYSKANHVRLARGDCDRTEFFGSIGGVPDSGIVAGVEPTSHEYFVGDRIDTHPNYIDIGDFGNYGPETIVSVEFQTQENGAGTWTTRTASYIVENNQAVRLRVEDDTGDVRIWSIDTQVVHVPPTVDQALPPQSFSQNSGIYTEEAAPGFTGLELTFNISLIAGVSINPVSGQMSFDSSLTALQSGTAVIVTATNTGGSSQQSFQLFVSPETVEPVITNLAFTGDQVSGTLPVSCNITGAATARAWGIYTGATPTITELRAGTNMLDFGTVDIPADGGIDIELADGLFATINLALDDGNDQVLVATGGPRDIDTQAPTGTLTATTTGSSTADIVLNLTQTAGDVIDVGVWLDGDSPTIPDDIEDGTGSQWHSPDNVGVVGANNFSATSLPASSVCRARAVIEDPQGQKTTLVSAAFTTDAAGSPLVASQIGGIWDILNNNNLLPAEQDVTFVSAVAGREVFVNGVFLQVGGTGFTVAVTSDPDGAQPAPVTVNTVETSLSNGGACMSFWFAAPDAETYRISVTPITNNWRKGKAEIFDIQNRTAYEAVEDSPTGSGVVDLSVNVATGDLVTVGNCQVDSNDDGVVQVGFSTYNFYQDLAGSRAAGIGHHFAATPESPRTLSIEWISVNERSTLRTKVS